MFGKKYLETAAVGASLLALNCGAATGLEVGTSESGSGGMSVAGSSGKGGEAGTNSSSSGGMNGVGGMGGSADCKLVQNLKVLENPFDPLSASTGFADVTFDVLEESEITVVIKKQGALIAQIANIPDQMPSLGEDIGWGGDDEAGNLVPNGIYTAELTAINGECMQTESVDFQVASVITNCKLNVASAASNVDHITEPGADAADLGCYELRAADCDIEIESLSLEDAAPGNPRHLSALGLYSASGTLISGLEDFEDGNNNIAFNNLSIVIPNGFTQTVCVKGNVSNGANDGEEFRMTIESAEDILAVGMGEFVTVDQIGASFPVQGDEVTVVN